MRAGLVARVRSNQSPAVWQVVATGCRIAGRVSRHRSRWSSRLGYALEQRDRARAAHEEARALRRSPARDQVTALIRTARERQRAGELVAAAQAWQQAVELAGPRFPGWAVSYADLLDQLGRWREAQQVLTANLALHPDHPLSHRRLGEITMAVAQWGGSYTAGGGFTFESIEAAVAGGRRALERAAELEPAKTTWREALAEARHADHDLAGAIALYEVALLGAEQSTGRWVLAVKQRWQFRLESLHAQRGAARVEDPLFGCAVEPGKPLVDPAPVPGVFTAQLGFGGLAISGVTADRGLSRVEILLDGAPIRSVNLGGDEFLPRFQLEVKRASLAHFPPESVLTVQTPEGVRLRSPGGGDAVTLSIPHGTGELAKIMTAGGKLDKKGVLSPSTEQTRLRQQRYLEIYAKVRDFFEQELGRPLFLMYGTLLGYHRQGDFIPGDDDFDCGYVSDQPDPASVKEETKRLIVQLVRAGFTVSFNRKGRLFRIQLEREATDGYHLDVRPLWFQDGQVWVHNHCSFPATRADFLPAAEGELRGKRVLAPHDTEKFLRNHYGPGWHTPDPAFMYYLSEIDPTILDRLGQALITVNEYHDLAERVRREAGDGPPAGRLVSVGSQDLYPLSEFLA